MGAHHDPSSKPVSDELRKIYFDAHDEAPNLSSLDRGTGSALTRWLVRLFLLLLVLSVCVVVGFFVWNRGIFDSKKPLRAFIEGPTSIRTGEEVAYVVRYENTARLPLANLSLRLNLPTHFHLTAVEPQPQDPLFWKIGSLNPTSDGSVTIKGVYRSALDSMETIQALFTYQPANFTSMFDEPTSTLVSVKQSALDVTVTAPEQVAPGDEAFCQIVLQNIGSIPLEQVGVDALFPSALVVKSLEPKPSEDPLPSWVIPSLKPGETATILAKGRFANSTQAEHVCKATGFLLEDGNAHVSQGTKEAKTVLSGGSVDFHLIINGSTSRVVERLGKTLHTSFDYANPSNATLTDVTLSLVFESANKKLLPIDWEKAELALAKRAGAVMTWDKSIVKELEKFDPSASGILDLAFPLLPSIDVSKYTDTWTAKVLVSFPQTTGGVTAKRTIESDPMTITINDTLSLKTEARYFSDDGEPYGSGPLPPQVDESTSYRLFWKLDHSLHPLQDITVSTNLPPEVTWKERAGLEVGTVTYNPTTRLVEWKVPASAASASLETFFDVAITPRAGNVGSFMKLTNASNAQGKDSVTGETVTTSTDIVTTDLLTDSQAKGKGIVEDK